MPASKAANSRAGWLTTAAAHIAPKWALSRLQAKMAFDVARRAYDAAKVSRHTDGWISPSSSANAELRAARATIQYRARDLVRNNPYAVSATRKIAAKMVGTGITPQLRGGIGTQKKKFMDVWTRFSDNCDPAGLLDFYGLQNLIARTVTESGECFIRRIVTGNKNFPIQVQVLEPDYLDTRKEGATSDGNIIIQGIEFNKFGQRVAYWMFDHHPGDINYLPKSGGLLSQRFDAKNIQHVFEVLRPGQARGVSFFAPVILKLRDIGEYEEAELVRKKIEACFAVFVKSPSSSPRSPLTDKDSEGRRVETLEPGMVNYLNGGEDIEFGNPSVIDGTLSHLTYQLHAVAAGLGLPYSMLTGDLSQVNYSSIRAGLLDFWDLLDGWQWHMMVPQLNRPIFNAVKEIAAGVYNAPLGNDVTLGWSMPKRPWIDPLKDTQAVKESIKAGLTTWEDAVAEQGKDPDQQLDEIADAQKKMDDLGVAVDVDARRDTKLLSAPAKQNDQTQN